MQLAINNRQAKAKIENFRAILSNPITNKRSRDKAVSLSATPVNFTTLLGLAKSSRQTIQQKKVVSTLAKIIRLNCQNSSSQVIYQAFTSSPLA